MQLFSCAFRESLTVFNYLNIVPLLHQFRGSSLTKKYKCNIWQTNVTCPINANSISFCANNCILYIKYWCSNNKKKTRIHSKCDWKHSLTQMKLYFIYNCVFFIINYLSRLMKRILNKGLNSKKNTLNDEKVIVCTLATYWVVQREYISRHVIARSTA